MAQPIAKELISKGQVQRGFIGILTESLTPANAKAKGYPVDNGVLIDSVQPGTPAEKAGLKAGDLIVKLGNVDIHNTGDLEQVLTQDAPGSTVKIQYYRGKNKQSVSLTLGVRPASAG